MALGWVWWRAWLRLALWHLCVEAMALSDIDMTFAWLHLVISALLLCARCGTYGMGWVWWRAWPCLALWHFCVTPVTFGGTDFCGTRVVLDDVDVTFVWQA